MVARAALVPAGTPIHLQVADALERQNRRWGASKRRCKIFSGCARARMPWSLGSKSGLFGGPLLSLFKVASVLALAKQVESADVPCVPLFWMATEDHDLAEVNQALLLGSDLPAERVHRPGRRPRRIRRWRRCASRTERTSGRAGGEAAGRRRRWRRCCARATARARLSLRRSPSCVRGCSAITGWFCSIRPMTSCIASRRRCLSRRLSVRPSWTTRYSREMPKSRRPDITSR